MGALDRLLDPRGIAIVGASDDATRGGGQPLNALLVNGYEGRLFPVNPNHRSIRGLPCFGSVLDIKEPCDLAVIALPARQVADVVRECGAAGIPYAVVYSGGFRETGPAGLALEADLIRAMHESNVRLIGPNCLGLVNVPDRVYASFGSLSRPPLLKAGMVSIVSQSGGLSHSIAMSCAAAGEGFRYLISSGNEVDITAPELIDACLDDEQTRIVLCYMEGVGDGRALMEAGRKALRLGKAVVVWKVGNTEGGKRAAASHTANMTGTYDVYRAAFRQSGIVEARSFEDFVDFVKVFRSGRIPEGPGVALVSASGGVGIVFSDEANSNGLVLPTLEDRTLEVLASSIGDIGVAGNPMDLPPGFLNDQSVHRFEAAVDALLRDPRIHQLCAMLMTIQGKQALNGARVLAAAAARSSKPILVFSAAPRETAGEALDALAAAGIPVFSSPTRLSNAAAAAAAYSATRRRMAASLAPGAATARRRASLPAARGSLNESDSKALLRSYGIVTTRDIVLAVESDELEVDFPGPYALKVLSADIAHKSDIGGVRLNLADIATLRCVRREMLARVRTAAPGARIEGFLVSEMISSGFEVLVGVINDPTFGPVVAFGFGGIFAELIGELSYRIAPFDQASARSMIAELRGSAILDGARGREALDRDALAQLLVSVSELAWELRETVREIDINPVILQSGGKGAVAADALVVLQDAFAPAVD